MPVIGDNVHIHKGAIVFGGITIGNNVAIGANAVVNRPVPDNAVVAGVPAKVLRIKDVE
ncbi:MAG: serine acetyltransferase [Alistipes sp.]|nr:serine acetyltransferase [Alistipes sp.]